VFVTMVVLAFNLVVDLLYAALDPRVRVYRPRQRVRRQRRLARRPRAAYASQSAQARS